MQSVSRFSTLWLAACLSIAVIGCSSSTSYEQQENKAIYGNAESFLLDKIAKQDIYETNFSINLPVNILIPTEQITKKSINDARIKAEKTLKGEIGKREPIKVVKRGDGNFSIIDGNKSFAYLKSEGAKTVPVEITFPYTKKVNSIDELISKNEAVKEEFEAKVREIQEKVGGELKLRPPKARKRIIEKINLSYKNNIGGVTDILAGRLIFDKSEGILKALEYIKNRADIIAYEDRWNTPLESGYMDVISFVRMSNGVIGELQFSLKGIMDINDLDHKLYEYIRSHEGNKIYKDKDLRIIKIKKKIIRLAVEGKGFIINGKKPEMISIADKLLQTETPAQAEKYVSQLEEIVKQI